MIEWFGLEDHLVLSPLAQVEHLPLDQVTQSPIQPWTLPGRGPSTAPLGNVCQGLTTVGIKNFFLRSDLNLPSSSLKPLPLVLSVQATILLSAAWPSRLNPRGWGVQYAGILQGGQQVNMGFFYACTFWSCEDGNNCLTAGLCQSPEYSRAELQLSRRLHTFSSMSLTRLIVPIWFWHTSVILGA